MAPHDQDIKAQVVAFLIAGGATIDAADRFGVHRTTVTRWKKQIPGVIQENQVRVLLSTERDDFPAPVYNYGRMVGEYLATALNTLRVQQEHFADKQWLNTQNASDMAILHGVTADKSLRIIEACQRVEAGHKQAG